MWIIPQLHAGETARRDVLCLCVRPADNAATRVTVTADGNISETAEAAIRILPPAATATPGPSSCSTADADRATDRGDFRTGRSDPDG